MFTAKYRDRFAVTTIVIAGFAAAAIGTWGLHQAPQGQNLGGIVVAGDPPDHNGQGGSGDGSTKGTGQGESGGGTGGGGHGHG